MGNNDWSDYLGVEDLPEEAITSRDHGIEISDEWISVADKPLQLAAMRAWFTSRFEDPANDTPYDGEEGGYFYIRGGPYDPNDEIQDRFSDVVAYEVMEDLIDELHGEVGDEWAPVDFGDEYDDYLRFEPEDRDEPRQSFQKRVAEIDQILTMKGPDAAQALLRQMAFSGVIAALEAYLAEMVSYWVGNDKEVMAAFVAGTKEFQEKKIPLSEVLEKAQSIEKDLQDHLSSLVWHRIDKLKPWIEKCMGIKFPDIGPLMKAVETRHDIVHRAGKTKAGELVAIQHADIQSLQADAKSFVTSVESALDGRFKRNGAIEDNSDF